jgi:hypothetical protein
MAEKKFLVDFNLGGNKAKNFRLEDYADNTAPTSNFVGRLIYTTNSTDPDRVEVYTGTGWEQLSYLSDAPVLDQDLVDIAALTGNGILARQSGVWVMDSNVYLTSETDPVFTASEAYNITSTDTGNWDTAYGWGDHAGVGYLTTESDPTFTASTAYGIDSTDVSNWDTAYGWGDHAGAGYVTLTGVEVLTNKTFNDYVQFTNPSTIPTDGEIGINDSNENFEITALSADLVLSAGLSSTGDVTVVGDNINIDTPTDGDILFKSGGTEYFGITKAYTGTTRLTAVDDLAIKSTGGDILLYPAGKLGGIGKVYIGWGNANPDTGYGIANPGSEVITVDYVTGFTNTLSAQQFRADLIDSGENYYGGYTFKNDGGYDSGMFSNTDGDVSFYSNDELIAHINTTTFTVDKDLVVTGDLTVNGTLTTLNTETVTVEDNILVLNSNVTGTPTLNSGLEVERGDYTNASLLWNETDNNWTVSTVKDSTAAAVTHSIARKYSETLTADPAATSFVITHSLNTRDVIAQVYTVASPYEQVEVAIEYTSVDTITVKFNEANSGDYRVVVTG